jgi:hypothetical protein
MKREPCLHFISSDYGTFYAQSCRASLLYFAAAVSEDIGPHGNDSFYSVDPSTVENEAVRIRCAVRLDGRMPECRYCLVDATPGDRGAFVAWAWPPPSGDYPRVDVPE